MNPARVSGSDDEVPELRRRLGAALERRHTTMHERFDRVDTDLAALKTEVNNLDARVERIDKTVNNLDARVERIDKAVGGLETRFGVEFEAHRRNTEGLIATGFEQVKIELKDMFREFADEVRQMVKR